MIKVTIGMEIRMLGDQFDDIAKAVERGDIEWARKHAEKMREECYELADKEPCKAVLYISDIPA